MLEAGRSKAPRAEVVVGDATALPFADGEFAAVVCGFGMRNLSDPARGRARGRCASSAPAVVFVTLELFRADAPGDARVPRAYARVVLPARRRAGSRASRGAYQYLARSMAGFCTRAEYERVLSRRGLRRACAGRDLTLGVASIVRGEVQA